MIKFFKKLFSFPFRKISRNAKRTNLGPERNRKHVGKSLFFLAIALFTIFIFRFVWLITVNHVGDTNLKVMATSNYESTINVPATRGTIYDRNGTPIAVDSSTYTIFVVLDKSQKDANGNKLYADSAEFSKIEDFLNKNLGIDRTLIDSQLHSKLKQVQFGSKGSNISLQKMQALRKSADDEKLVGIGFSEQGSRSYPLGNFASQFIGIARPDDSTTSQTLKGDMGLEKAFNSILSGKNGVETYQKDILGRPIPGTTKVIKPVKNGQDVYTTLSAPLQQTLETRMDAAVQDTGAQTLEATLVDAHTGEILATSQRPTYTPTTINTAEKQKNFTWNSLLSQSAFEPGSVMKTFLMASALDSNKVDLNATYQRKLQVYDATINDWDVTENKSYTLPEVVNYAQGFAMSSNIGMSRIEMNMGNSLWDSYLNKFKFGLKTRAGLDGEVPGSLPSANLVSQIQSAFGQGIAVTPIQLIRGWTAIAGNGTMLEPHIVNKIYDPNTKTTLQSEKEIIGHPVSNASVTKVRDLMVDVNTDPVYGTSYSTTGDPDENISPGPLFMVNGQPAAVKTGTAQIASTTGGYMDGSQDYLYSAVVMYPPKNPDFIFYMNVKIPSEPWTLKYIARVANPLLTQAESKKSELNTVDNTDKAGKVTLSDYKGADPGETSDSLRRTVLNPVIVGSGTKITAQSIAAGEKVSANTRVLLLTDDKNQSMPDMYDWSKDEVEQLAKWYDLKVTYEGSGNHVQTQSIGAVTSAKKGQSLTVKMGT
ncbi:penicillin-binding transpeptidase domain-containing protein [Lactococcus allomyrinae]|uniref:Penicillin-binding protein n=1 Tax=Lactococcus allomyrinae TaxID=2419773 RepID=A0A387BHR4_9LACT|nr:penicillin-binding transpeptidase domain-containing protein [Lactococcus allomyrinae]AYG00557.1 penicillin-binding protein [Lactococcus allomyrinae]